MQFLQNNLMTAHRVPTKFICNSDLYTNSVDEKDFSLYDNVFITYLFRHIYHTGFLRLILRAVLFISE